MPNYGLSHLELIQQFFAEHKGCTFVVYRDGELEEDATTPEQAYELMGAEEFDCVLEAWEDDCNTGEFHELSLKP